MSGRFTEALLLRKAAGFIPVIPDIKCRSPKEGDLLKGRDPVDIALSLTRAGAPVLSVVTEGFDFGGSDELLSRVAVATGRPILRKDFIKSAEDIKKTKALGADAVLLICATLIEAVLESLYEEALAVGLEPLIETHTEKDLAFAGKLGAKLIGINNRDILKLEKDSGTVNTTERLAKLSPKGAFLVSESSIQSQEEAKAAIRAGADAVLVGTAILKASDTASFYNSLCDGR